MALTRSPYETGELRMRRGLFLQFFALGLAVLGVGLLALTRPGLVPWVVLVAAPLSLIGLLYAVGAVVVGCPNCSRSVFPNQALFGIWLTPFRTCPRCGNDNTAVPAVQD